MTDPAAAAAPSITFFFPYHDVSGVPVLFLRMARHLAASGRQVRVVDYPDGYMARTLGGAGPVAVVPFHDGMPLTVGPDTTLVLQSILPYNICGELVIDPAARLVFWTLHPLNLVQTIIPLDRFRDLQARHLWFHRAAARTVMRRLTARLRDAVTAMHRCGALFFMDGETLRMTCERLEMDIEDPVFVPVGCEDVPDNRKLGRGPGRGEELSVAWLGRFADFKIHILRYTIRRLSQHARRTGAPVAMHLIGEGPLEADLDGPGIEHAAFRLVRPGVLTDLALEAYLLERVHVLAAMGASALEGARLGIPTLLLDLSYGPVRGDYVFRWLFESTRYCLGEVLDARRYRAGNDSLGEALAAARDGYDALSRRTYDFCRSHHGMSAVASAFLAAVERASFRYGDFPPEALCKGEFRRTYEWVRRISRSARQPGLR